MNYWVQISQLNSIQALREAERASRSTVPFSRLIPPERVGLDGDYDHSGLSKRVMSAFQEQFEVSEIAQLQVLQRGRVIIFLGRVSNSQLLTRLINVALEVHGASTVETHGVMVLDEMKIS